ncbi:MAG: penicillin-binding transpeptidase domain-containing protein, partial [Acidimicrobiales bacterium]
AAKFDQTRGLIQSADRVVLAESIPAPKGSSYKYQREYPTHALFGQITGVISNRYGSYGVEDYYNSYLLSHNRPVKTLGDLLSTQTVTDTVTLTLSDTLQTVAMNALGGRDGAIVVLDPSTGAIDAMYSNPSFDPSPLTSEACVVPQTVGGKRKCAQTVAQQAWGADTSLDSEGFRPLTSLAYQDATQFPPGSTFKIVTASAAYEHAPQLVDAPMPYYTCINGGTLGGQAPNKPLCNDPGTGNCGGTIAEMLPPSCDTGFAILGTKVGAASMTAEADAYGFNQQPPIDLPHSRNEEVSDFLQPSCDTTNAEIFLAQSSIGQKCTDASPLQMAMVAAGIANKGVVMTPHVMSDIRDSQDNLVQTYKPTQWLRATSPQTAAAINTLMTEVVTSGTADGVGFPASEDVAAKTGTAQIGLGNTGTTDWMIAFAPASAPKVAVAVMIPNQTLYDYGAPVAGPLVKTMIAAALGGQ